jgi:uncharacterized protein (DUF362 family)
MEVELDSRARAPLAKVLPKDAHGGRYRVERRPDGVIVMTPVVSLTERELSVLARPELVQAIRKGVDQAHAGQLVGHGPGEFAKLAADLGIDVFGADEED